MDDIVLFQILPRLPARSIGRFMSVCKQWHEFLRTLVFTKMHLNHVNNQNQPKILAVSSTNPCNYFGTIDCEKPEVGLSAKRPLPFKVGSNHMMSILSSLNGLVCVGIYNPGLSLWPSCHTYSDIILWNPLTGDYKTLSKDNSHGNCFNIDARGYWLYYSSCEDVFKIMFKVNNSLSLGNCFNIGAKGYGFYYSSCDDDYKLLLVTQSGDAYIYSWKSESWRKAKSRVDSLLKYCNDCNCLLNEKLYFVAQRFQGSSNKWSSLIIRFDTKTEMFTEIATPSSFDACYTLTVVGGCIHLGVIIKDLGKLESWKMDGDGEWMKVIHSCTLPFMLQPRHLMKNGNWLVHSYRNVIVFKVHPKEAKEACKYTIDGTMRLLQNGKFLETIVSLKR